MINNQIVRQHLQFLRCLNDGFPKDPCLLCGLCVVHFTDITKSKGDSCLSTMKLVPAIILLPSSLKKLTKSGYLLLSPLLSKQDLPKLVGQLFRVDIWRDRCDRRSRNFFCELRKFLGKQREMLYNLTPK